MDSNFPIKQSENKSVRLELMDLAFFPGKENNDTIRTSSIPALATNSKGYLTIKFGYKYIFSESKTGIYVEPSVGWGRVVDTEGDEGETTYGDGLALAFETGYSLEVGERGHVLTFGIKYENDRGGTTISSVGFRVVYAFNFLTKKSEY